MPVIYNFVSILIFSCWFFTRMMRFKKNQKSRRKTIIAMNEKGMFMLIELKTVPTK